MPQIIPETPKLVKILEFVVENWQLLLAILGLSILGLGRYWHDVQEQP